MKISDDGWDFAREAYFEASKNEKKKGLRRNVLQEIVTTHARKNTRWRKN